MSATTQKQQAAMSRQRIQGRVWKYGDGINTGVIFPGKYTYTVIKKVR